MGASAELGLAAGPWIRTRARGSKVPRATATQPGIMLDCAEGRTRTDTGVASQQFLRLPRLPFRHFGKCRGAESNCRHADFQSAALPLSYLGPEIF